MRREWIGAGLLAVLLLVSLLAAWCTGRCCSTVAAELEDALWCALGGDWEGAVSAADGAEAKWKRWWHWTAVTADHAPMEEIDSLLARLEIFGAARERTLFASTCAQLSRRITDLADVHTLHWWNLF